MWFVAQLAQKKSWMVSTWRKFPHFPLSKKNSFRRNYSRKYGNLMINLMTLNERTVLARWINGLKVPRISGRLMTKNQSPHLFLSHWMLFFSPFPLAQYIQCNVQKVLFKARHFFKLSYFLWIQLTSFEKYLLKNIRTYRTYH